MIAIRISVAGYDLILNGYVDLKALKLIFCSLFAALLNNSNAVNILFNFYYI